MATIKTAQFGGSTCPQAQLEVTISSQTATSATLAWTLKWVTHGYTVSSSASKDYSVKINGATVKTGSFAVGGKSSQTITSGTVNITKGTAAKSIPIALSFDMTFKWKSTYGGTKTASGSISVGAKTSYTIKYNANGGSGAPSSQTKWHGTNITLSKTKPTRSGYTFVRWDTNSSGTGTSYNPGATYSANSAVTLYAIWSQITYPVTYNANGGSGAPASQTKKHGTTLTLSTTKPTRANYTFKGWATSATGKVAYAAGANYTANAKLTLYAVWELAYTKPVITNLKAVRCSSDGTVSETGKYAKVTFNWATCTITGNVATVSSIKMAWGSSSATATGSGSSGSVSQVVGANALDTEKSYTFTVTVTDNKNGSTSKSVTISGTKFPIDFKAGGSGVAIGKPAETAALLDVNYEALFRAKVKSTYAPASAAESEIQFLAQNATSGTNTGFRAKRTDSGTSVFFGVGGGGTNHGVYSEDLKAWMIGSNGTDTQVNAKSGGIISCGNTVSTDGSFRLDKAYTSAASMNCRWADNALHDIVSRGSDGLACYLGPTNFDSTKKTVTNIRGYTVRLYNHGGGTYLGSSGSTAVTSDRNYKKDITDLGAAYEDFFSRLQPVSYKYNTKEYVGHRDHLGYIAQDVEAALTASGLTTEQFAGICVEENVTLNYDTDSSLTEEECEAKKCCYDKLYSLRYEEFIALNTHMIQKLQQENEDLKTRVTQLETLVNTLVNQTT